MSWKVEETSGGFIIRTKAGALHMSGETFRKKIEAIPEMLRELRRIHYILERDGGSVGCIAGNLESKRIAKILRKAGIEP